jgi:hypothetical protein
MGLPDSAGLIPSRILLILRPPVALPITFFSITFFSISFSVFLLLTLHPPSMRTLHASLLVAAAHLGLGQYLGYDPRTIEDCTAWFNWETDLTCEEVRDTFGMTQEQFTRYNPSIGPDCRYFSEGRSYCIADRARWEEYLSTRTETISGLPTPTYATTNGLLAPTPTAWESRGCYPNDDDANSSFEVLDETSNKSLTVPECQHHCYVLEALHAAVQDGSRCMCVGPVEDADAVDESNCNVPCPGDKTTMCGGRGFAFVYRQHIDMEQWRGDWSTQEQNINSAAASSTESTRNPSSTGVPSGSGSEETNSNEVEDPPSLGYRSGITFEGALLAGAGLVIQLFV